MSRADGRGVNFVDERERELFALATLGEEARRFLLEHPVGRYLHHRAKVEVQQAEIDALEVNPDSWRGWFRERRRLRTIRMRAAVARTFINWLAEAIVNGDNAEKELEDYRN